MTKTFFAYMMSNQSRVVLHTGVTDDPTRRKRNELVEILNPKWIDLSGKFPQLVRSPSHSLGMTA